MVREDILGGLRNALERGETLELAKSSMINSGYPEKDVNEAAAELSAEQEKFIPAPIESKNKEIRGGGLKAGEIKDVIDISKLKNNGITEVPTPQLPKKKSRFLRFFIIFFGGILILVLIGIIAYLITKSLDIDIFSDLIDVLK